MERRRRDAEPVRDLSCGDVGVGEHRLGGIDVVVGEFRRSASRPASATRGGQPRLGALADQAALEFRKRAKHVKNQTPLRGRRVEGFGQTAKPDAPYPQGFDGFDQLLHRPRQAIELLHDQRVAAAREFERVMQGRAVGNRTRHLLGENLLAPCFGQRVALQGEILVNSRISRA